MASQTRPSTHRVLIADNVSPKGIDLLRETPGFEVTVKTGMGPEELRAALADHDALIVRSATKVTEQVLAEPGSLRVIGRAGTGVDNIHLPAATRAGVVVMNTPGGNSVAAAELTIAHLTSLARNVAQSNADLREGRWERKKYVGMELDGKTLGVVGLGRIGREVARRARGLRMEVIGYDPFVSSELAASLGIRLTPLDELVAGSDVVTLHLPLTDESRHLFDAAMIARMRPGSALINCARGGLIDESALLEALDSGHLGGAALDVFESEPPSDFTLVKHARVVATPHLGASTREAQERVGTEIAEKIRDFLRSGTILDAVNFPAMDRESSEAMQPAMGLAEKLGSFLAQSSGGGFRRLEVRTQGSLAEHSLRPLAMAAAKGLISHVVEGGISFVNALSLANERGITVDEARSSESSHFSGLLRLTLQTDAGESTVAGTLYSPDRPRLVEIDGVSIEARPEGHMLMVRNRDVPGVVGQIGTILGRQQINIAGIHLGRGSAGEDAVSIIDVDEPVPAAALKQIEGIDEVLFIRSVSI